jgi:hypothetical protein
MRRARTPGHSSPSSRPAPPFLKNRLDDALQYGQGRPQTAPLRAHSSTSSTRSSTAFDDDSDDGLGGSERMGRRGPASRRPGDVASSVVFSSHSAVTGEAELLVAFPRVPLPLLPLQRPGTGDRTFSTRSRQERQERHGAYWATQVEESKQRAAEEARANFETTQHNKWKLILQLAGVSRRRNANWHKTQEAYRKDKARKKKAAARGLKASIGAQSRVEKDLDWDTSSSSDGDGDGEDGGSDREGDGGGGGGGGGSGIIGGTGEGEIVDDRNIRRLSRNPDDQTHTNAKSVFTSFWLSLGADPLVTKTEFRERIKDSFDLKWEEADDDLNTLFTVLDEDCDDHVDWRDFVLYLRVMERPRERVRHKLLWAFDLFSDAERVCTVGQLERVIAMAAASPEERGTSRSLFHEALIARGWDSCATVAAETAAANAAIRGNGGSSGGLKRAAKQRQTMLRSGAGAAGVQVTPRGAYAMTPPKSPMPSSPLFKESPLFVPDALQGNIPYNETPHRQRRESAASFAIMQRFEHTILPPAPPPETKHVDWANAGEGGGSVGASVVGAATAPDGAGTYAVPTHRVPQDSVVTFSEFVQLVDEELRGAMMLELERQVRWGGGGAGVCVCEVVCWGGGRGCVRGCAVVFGNR